MEGFNDYTRMFRVDRSIEGFRTDSDVKKWPRGLMEVRSVCYQIWTERRIRRLLH